MESRNDEADNVFYNSFFGLPQHFFKMLRNDENGTILAILQNRTMIQIKSDSTQCDFIRFPRTFAADFTHKFLQENPKRYFFATLNALGA